MRKWISIALVFLLWELLGRSGILPPYRFPPPSVVAMSFTSNMGYGLLATAARTVVGFVCGVALAYLLVLAAFLGGILSALDDQFSGARAVPFLAAAPLFVMWFGIGELSRLIVVLLSVGAFSAGPLGEAVRALPREWTIQRQRYGKGRSWDFVHLVVPGTLGAMIGPLRVALAVALTVAIASDFMGATLGIGRAVDSARVTFNTPAIFLLIFLSAALGIALDKSIGVVLRTLGHWVGRTSKT